MNNGKRYAYKNNLLKKLVTTRSFSIQLFFLLLFILFVAFHNRHVFKKRENDDNDDDEDDDHVSGDATSSFYTSSNDVVGIECAYTFAVDEKISTWKDMRVVISLDRSTSCFQQRPPTWGPGASVFRVHAYSVHEMVTSHASYIDDEKSYVARLLLTFPVKYTVMVLLVHVNGLTTDRLSDVSRPLLRQLLGSPFNITVTKNHSNTNQATRYCTRNESGRVQGRWVRCGGAVRGLERCGAWLNSDFDLDGIHGFRWVPYTCQYHQYTNDQLRKCFSRNQWDSVVLAGDDLMKFRTFHWVTRFHGNCHACARSSPRRKVFSDGVPRLEWVEDPRGTRLPQTFLNKSLDVEKLLNPKQSSHLDHNHSVFPFDAEALQATVFVLNFGRAVLRETNDMMLINIKLHTYGKAAQQLQNMGKVVVWLNSPTGTPWSRDHIGDVTSKPRDVPAFRMRHFNKVAGRIMRHYKIPVVEAFDVADGRIQAVRGHTHYVKKLPGNDFGGVVENTITNCIMNFLCNE